MSTESHTLRTTVHLLGYHLQPSLLFVCSRCRRFRHFSLHARFDFSSSVLHLPPTPKRPSVAHLRSPPSFHQNRWKSISFSSIGLIDETNRSACSAQSFRRFDSIDWVLSVDHPATHNRLLTCSTFGLLCPPPTSPATTKWPPAVACFDPVVSFCSSATCNW